MRKVNVSESMSEELLALPETGMGFQLLSSATHFFVIFNASEGFAFNDEEELIAWLYQPKVAEEPGEADLLDIDGVQLLATRITAPTVASLAPPATLVTTTTADGKRVFYRFSAYNPDKRINPTTGALAPGTYTTTDNDQTVVPSGLAAVGRFALPNTAPAIHVHECTPALGTAILVGTVAPAYGQAGGGVEALFAAGAASVHPPKSTTRPDN